MTNFTKDLALAAAVLMMAAGAASAQALRADIPFAFQAGNKVMPAGSYRVAEVSTNSAGLIALQNDDGPSVFVQPEYRDDPARSWHYDGQPKLAFECAGERCALLRVWSGGARPVYHMMRPRSMSAGTRIAVVIMRPDTY